jgi:hypothetical protein
MLKNESSSSQQRLSPHFGCLNVKKRIKYTNNTRKCKKTMKKNNSSC